MEFRVTLHDKQYQIAASQARFKVAACGRKFGKTFLAAHILLAEGSKTVNDFGIDLTGTEVWYVAPTYDQGKINIWHDLLRFGGYGTQKSIIKAKHENTSSITLINNRIIRLKGSDRPENLRGANLSYAVLDEYAQMRPEIWQEIIRPMFLTTRGGALFIGTPKYTALHFEQIYKQACDPERKNWEAFLFSAKENPYISPEELEEIAGDQSSAIYAQEIDAAFDVNVDSDLKEEWLNDAIVMKQPRICSQGFWYVLVDLAGFTDALKVKMYESQLALRDRTAISVVCVHPKGWHVKEIIAGRWGVEETATRIVKAAKSIHCQNVGIEKGALLRGLESWLTIRQRELEHYFKLHHLSTGGKSKIDRIQYALQGRFEKGKITLKDGPWISQFRREYILFPTDKRGEHDDLLDSLSYTNQMPKCAWFNPADFQGDDWEPLDSDAGF